MKKIFLLAISLPFLVCGGFYNEDEGFSNNTQQHINSITSAISSVARRDSENYWLNNFRSFKTYPINYYQGNHENASETNVQTTTHHTQEYPKNIPISAYVGQRIIGDETYTVTTSDMGEHYEISTDGEIRNSIYQIKLSKRQVMTPIGEVLINGRYFLVFEPEQDGRMLLADENGQIMHNIGHYYRGELLISRDITTVIPKDLSIIKTSDIQQTSSEPQLQYEIYYKGLVDGQMQFSHIDFINGRTEKTFVFPISQQIVNIEGKSIKILSATDENIQYILLN